MFSPREQGNPDQFLAGYIASVKADSEAVTNYAIKTGNFPSSASRVMNAVDDFVEELAEYIDSEAASD